MPAPRKELLPHWYIEGAINDTYLGLVPYARDVNLTEKEESLYYPGKIIRAGG